MDRGILVGCDAAQEWLLEWWWERYRETNRLPVAFADFGMSEGGKKWCRARGQLVSIFADRLRVASKLEIDSSILKKWDRYVSPFWNSRGAWFKKPFAFLQTPFEQTVQEALSHLIFEGRFQDSLFASSSPSFPNRIFSKGQF